MNYCSHCGETVRLAVPQGDDRLRYLCDSCGTIHYQNPRIIAGTLPIRDGKVLLCRRAIEPRLGYWTLPAGFMENAETTSEAAARETREEAGAEVNLQGLYTLIDLPHINQVYMLFRAELTSDFSAGIESLEVALFAEEEIPWQSLAFPTMEVTLRRYFEDRRARQGEGEFPLHLEQIDLETRERFFKMTHLPKH
ncbi:NUDIX domain-containing protein [Cobetia marina]|uniref:NUDIX hydrolase n=1 Tax=Cobetia marina TaxID=28258 RepID=UPI0010ADDE2E|nr:NUDIX hydrolase [Cobetia marina]TKD63038.1 NUDIX domain-containing protein [Cobetia marina]GED42370.1 NUDIX hydrolase [Cobetia marina]